MLDVRFVDQIFCLVRIVLQIVQFIEIEAVEDEFPVALPDDALSQVEARTMVFAVGGGKCSLGCLRISQQWYQGF